MQESACGCAGIYSSPVALAIYAQAFEQAGALANFEGFASFHGPDFYGLPRNSETLTLKRKTWTIPQSYDLGDKKVVPMFAGMEISWSVENA
jgi:dihydroorotase